MNFKKHPLVKTLLAFGTLLLSSCTGISFAHDSALSSTAPASSDGDASSASSTSTSTTTSTDGGSSSSSTLTTSAGSSSSSEANSSSRSSSSSSFSSSSSANTDGYYKVTGDTTTSAFNYKSIGTANGTDSLPTTGNHNVLVLPIELEGYSFPSSILSDVNTALNGENGTGYWESLASFYKKSSFGALSLNYIVADKYVTGLTPAEFFDRSTDDLLASSYILRLALANYKSKTGDKCTQFDSEGDGYIDAVIMIYSCPDVSRSNDIAAIDTENDLFWAFCYWDYTNDANPSKTSPIGMNYFWMSYDFLYEGSTSPNPDAHTLIHESGHLMGADDYYCYDTLTSGRNEYTPSPMGGIAMMDENVTDHDIFTKLAFDWVKPYVVTGNATLTINPSETSGDCILIPARNTTWNGTAFDEYLLLELYTPTGLNELDSKTQYSYSTQGYTTAGVRLLHVDSRVAKVTVDSSGNITNTSYLTGVPSSLPSSATTGCLIPQSNTPSRRYGEAESKKYNLVSLIQAGHSTNTLQYGENKGDNNNLFKTGSSFTQAAYSSFFAKGSLLDNGFAFGYKISFDSVSATSATISFQAI